jgi:Glu-tRNA(Gln) amidotransferase subunit E-like FAD-binding protein
MKSKNDLKAKLSAKREAKEQPPMPKEDAQAQAFQLIAGYISEEDASEEVKAMRKAILDGSWVKN